MLDLTRKVRVRFTAGSWTSFTGLFGRHYFTDGVSKDEMPLREGIRIGCCVGAVIHEGELEGRVLTADFKLNYDPGKISLNDIARSTAESKGEEYAEPINVQIPDHPADLASEGDEVIYDHQWTEVELETVADSGGIDAIRKIADVYGVKERSVGRLITKILEAQKSK